MTAHTFDQIADAYRARTFAAREARFPGEAATVHVKLLSEREMDLARIDAIAYVKENRVDTVVDRDETLDRETRRQILHEAFVHEHEGRWVPFISTPSKVRELDALTVDRLFEIYLDHQAAIVDASMPTAEQLDAAINVSLEAGEVGQQALAATLDARALRALVLRLFARVG